MKVSQDKVVAIDYTLTDAQGQVIDSSEGRGPLSYLHGHDNIIPGLEKALDGKDEGEQVQVTVEAAEAYGEHRAELVQEVPIQAFAGVEKVEPGMRFTAESPQGPMTVKVTKVEGETVTVDANHELAGQSLHFDVTVRDVRDATESELESGRPA
ncbi:MAG: peptidylprolyl isomerase [Wenzhouxiangellaceae bacterium]